MKKQQGDLSYPEKTPSSSSKWDIPLASVGTEALLSLRSPIREYNGREIHLASYWLDPCQCRMAFTSSIKIYVQEFH